MPDTIAIAGEVWSANLGDPLIHACLRHLVLRLPDVGEVRSLDLEGRDSFQAETPVSARRRPLPPTMRARAWWLLRRRTRQQHWAKALSGCRALLIGGGHLLAAEDMLFPPRLAALAQLAGRAGIPLAVTACGASPPWDRHATRLLDRPFAKALRAVLVRDRASADCLAATFPRWPIARVAPDPAVWAGELYGITARRDADAPLGLGIAPLGRGDPASDAAWWSGVVRALAERSCRCELFGNGAPEDHALIDRVAAATGAACAPRPGDPRRLVEIIAHYRAIVSARLHAGVAAFAVGVPALGVSAHGKVAGFWEAVGLPERALGLPEPAVAAARLADLGAGGGDPPAALPQAREQVEAELRRLLAAVCTAPGAPSAVVAPGRRPRPAERLGAAVRRVCAAEWLRTGCRRPLAELLIALRGGDPAFEVPFGPAGQLIFRGDLRGHIDRQVFMYGAYAMPELRLLRACLAIHPAPVLLDIGANIGNHSLWLAPGCAAVHAFEPSSRVRALLASGIARNRLANIAVHPVGLGAAAAVLPLFQPDAGNLGMGTLVAGAGVGEPTDYVRVVPGDAYCSEQGITTCQVMKIDVEGFEVEVLRGLSASLRAWRPIVFLEHSYNSALRVSAELAGLLPPNYRLWAVGPPRIRGLFFSASLPQLSPVRGGPPQNILAVPDERHGALAFLPR